MKTVFILGAGASAEAGAPLMGDFIARAKKLHAVDGFGQERAQIQDVLDAAYKDLKPVQVKSSIAYHNIEELFSAIDMGAMLNVFGSRDPSTLQALQTAVRVFIYRTIEETVRLTRVGQRIESPKGYATLAELTLEKIKRTARYGHKDVSFITFNYDTCLEFALVRAGLGVDYGLDEPFVCEHEARYQAGRQVAIPVLKLHGSINWAQCLQCNVVAPTEIDFWRPVSFMDVLDQPKSLPLPVGTHIAKLQHRCGSKLDPVPVIVPPTWNKAANGDGLQSVWKRAAQELGSADNIVVIGYSMPVTDTFFKYLFALGSDSDVHLEKFVVINGTEGGQSEQRFKDLLGPMSAKAFRYHSFVFSGARKVIEEVLAA